jgi:hypothetical protein
MKHNVFTIRLAPETAAQVTREALRRGITRTSWAAHLIERGQAVESLERLIPEALSSLGGNSAGGGIPSQAIERVVFAACFSEAILKKLNASLNRSSSELGTIAAQARDQALAETAALMKPAE